MSAPAPVPAAARIATGDPPAVVPAPWAVVVPSAPLLFPELTGPGADGAEPVRWAVTAAVAALVATAGDGIVVVGCGGRTARHPGGAWGTLAGLGVDVRGPVPSDHDRDRDRDRDRDHDRGPGEPSLPLSLTVGRLLLEAAGWHGDTVLQEIRTGTAPRECAHVGERLVADHPRAAWLVVGDGTIRRTERAPGAFDAQAEPFDAGAEAALAAGDARAVLGLDPTAAARLGAAGVSAWQTLAGAVGGTSRPMGAHIDYAGAPFGVGYLVVRWGPLEAGPPLTDEAGRV